MRSAVLQAESVRQSISGMWENESFDMETLLEEYHQIGRNNIQQSKIYKTIPVVAAWESIQEIADEKGYEFRVTRENPRNPTNEPTPDELRILQQINTSSNNEYFKVDHTRNEIIFARGIVLTEDCLACHGNPLQSPSGDGRDILGYPMEDWEAGETRGAFLLRAPLAEVTGVITSGRRSLLMVLVPSYILIIIGFLFLNRKFIVQPIRTLIQNLSVTSDNTADYTVQIRDSSNLLAENNSSQVAALEEITASITEVANISVQNNTTVHQGKTLLDNVTNITQSSGDQMKNLQTAMMEISESSKRSSKILNTIDDIAMQTNLLALNASVEAARAGEAGAGFAIVADEVRKLAKHSAESAAEINSFIQETIQKTETGEKFTNVLNQHLVDVNKAIGELIGKISEISQGSEVQKSAVEQIKEALDDLGNKSQSTAAQSEENTAISNDLDDMVHNFRLSIQELYKLIETENQKN